jgi:hypothetical protein
MLSLPESFAPELAGHKEDMLRYLGEVYGTLSFGHQFGSAFGVIVGVVYGVLLLSAVNTALMAAIGVLFMMATGWRTATRAYPPQSPRVPLIPVLAATLLPILTVVVTADFQALAVKVSHRGWCGAITG